MRGSGAPAASTRRSRPSAQDQPRRTPGEGDDAFVNIRIYEGHGKDKKDEIARRVTEAICDVTKLPSQAVWVVIEDIDPPDWYVAGKPGERMAK